MARLLSFSSGLTRTPASRAMPVLVAAAVFGQAGLASVTAGSDVRSASTYGIEAGSNAVLGKIGLIDTRLDLDFRGQCGERYRENRAPLVIRGIWLQQHRGRSEDVRLVRESDGLVADDENLFAVDLRNQLRRGRWGLALGFRVAEPEDSFRPSEVQELELSWTGSSHRVGLGRSPLYWGNGTSGSLLLGRSSLPRWQLRWRSERPMKVPVPGLRSTTWTGSTFFAYLDDSGSRRIDNPLFFGQRYQWQIRPWLEVGLTRTILFGGDGRTEKLTLGDLWDIYWAQNENTRGARPISDSDQKASFDARVRLPLSGWKRNADDNDVTGAEKGRDGTGGPNADESDARGFDADVVEVYWEYAGEDVNNPPIPSAVAHQYGALLRWSGWIFEYETTETNTGNNRWYDHTLYGDDAYTYRDLPLGHAIGGDAVGWHGAVTTPRARARVRLEYREESFGFHEAQVLRRQFWELGIHHQWNERTWIDLSVVYMDEDGDREGLRVPGEPDDYFEVGVVWVPNPIRRH